MPGANLASRRELEKLIHAPFPYSAALKKMKQTFQIVVYNWIPVTVGMIVGAILYGRNQSCDSGSTVTDGSTEL